jgi:hypothetical protein
VIKHALLPVGASGSVAFFLKLLAKKGIESPEDVEQVLG